MTNNRLVNSAPFTVRSSIGGMADGLSSRITKRACFTSSGAASINSQPHRLLQ
ncbi:Uncharacterised protein [Enterobacter cancerogenus]|uniref:Uncharacterized protein n=1 Tax=Enterobacter cancerogenus TaxID=69218 RepID=A0A484YN86_9ENTR|nr:Uncharacterised protein [Enterobacter cancerogenus]